MANYFQVQVRQPLGAHINFLRIGHSHSLRKLVSIINLVDWIDVNCSTSVLHPFTVKSKEIGFDTYDTPRKFICVKYVDVLNVLKLAAPPTTNCQSVNVKKKVNGKRSTLAVVSRSKKNNCRQENL